MAKGKTLCNVCGKEFNQWDEVENLGIHMRIGYGSKYDGDEIDLDMCCSCFDTWMDEFISQCSIDPIVVY